MKVMVNSLNWLHTRIRIGKENLDLSKSKTAGFERWVGLREGVLHRSFVWKAFHSRIPSAPLNEQ